MAQPIDGESTSRKSFDGQLENVHNQLSNIINSENEQKGGVTIILNENDTDSTTHHHHQTGGQDEVDPSQAAAQIDSDHDEVENEQNKSWTNERRGRSGQVTHGTQKGDDGPKYFYSATYMDTRMINNNAQDTMSMPRIRLGSEMEVKTFYDLSRSKYDEIIQMHRATNAIMAILMTAQKHLSSMQETFNKPAGTLLDDSSVNIFEAWVGTLAEVLRLLSIESSEVATSTMVGKVRLIHNAKATLETNMRETTSQVSSLLQLVEDLSRVVKSCEKSVNSANTGCRSRFFQSVWQTCRLLLMDHPMGQGGQGEPISNQSPWCQWFEPESSDKDVDDLMICLSSTVSTSSLLSLHLLRPYIRWDVDGVMIRKPVSKSWPFIKFATQTFSKKVEMLSEFFTGFLNFLQTPMNLMRNALEVLKEEEKMMPNKTPLPKNKNNNNMISLLDHQFQIILNILLSDRYFHPREQHIILVCAHKIKQSLKSLQHELEGVTQCCQNVSETWRTVFKNGELTLALAHLAVDSTNVHLWKSSKRFSFQLDLEMELDPVGTKEKFLPLKKSDIFSKNEEDSNDGDGGVKLPKLINTNIKKAIHDHFQALEDFEETYETRYDELARRSELVIVENDVTQCTDLAQQFFYHYEHISSILNGFCVNLRTQNDLLLDSIPTDPPTSPTTYSDFTPIRQDGPMKIEDSLYIVSLIGWEAAILEMLHCTRYNFMKLQDTPLLQKKLLEIVKSINHLKNLFKSCIRVGHKAEKSMARILNHVENYFDPKQDPMKILSRVSSDKNLFSVDKTSNNIIDNNINDKTKKKKKTDNNNCVIKQITPQLKEMDEEEGEVSMLVTLSGIYFNQFGVMFGSRLDTTSSEHQLRIIEVFISHIETQVKNTIQMVQGMLDKFGRDNFPANTWWKFRRPCLLRSFPHHGAGDDNGHNEPHHSPQLPPPPHAALIIGGSLQENVYCKSIFDLMKNLETAFLNDNVKAHLAVFSELETLILLRSSRIMEEEILRFSKICTSMYQGVKNLDKFQHYFGRVCHKFFRGGGNGTNSTKVVSPFDKWQHRISSFKLVVQDDQFKNKLDKILTSTASENLSRASSPTTNNMSTTNFFSTKNPTDDMTVVVTLVKEIENRWNVRMKDAFRCLKEKNAFLPQSGPPSINEIHPDPSKLVSTTTAHDDTFLSYTEAASICLAYAVTQLKLESYPKRSKLQLVKKLKSLLSKINECRAIVSHGVDICGEKTGKISTRLEQILKTYKHIHLRQEDEEEEDDDGPSSRLTGQEINVNSGLLTNSPPTNYEDSDNRKRSIKKEKEENLEGTPVTEILHEQDVFVSLNFAFQSLILSYRGYERETLFRSWSNRTVEQTRVMNLMMDFVEDRLTEIMDTIRKISLEYIRLNRAVKKLSVKIDQSLPLPLAILGDLIESLRRLTGQMTDEVTFGALVQGVQDILMETGSHLQLALRFVHKYMELDREEINTASNKSKAASTSIVRNPFEKDIRQLFTKPIRIVIPYYKFDLKLW